jgi:4,5-DOPA dioxygenase extradiol
LTKTAKRQEREPTQSTGHEIKMFPALFAGHGSPMNAIEDNEFSRTWRQIGEKLPRPSAILCISAHWETSSTFITAMPQPRTIHDFYGFPRELNQVRYSAPGAPEWAEKIRETIRMTEVRLTQDWGLDHGTWSVLCHMADVPVLQLSLDRTQPPEFHYTLGHELAALREKLLIIGSGNMVHNLRMIDWGGDAFDWAERFDRTLADMILQREHQKLVRYQDLGEDARLAIPTNEHYLPLLYILGLQGANEQVDFFSGKVVYGSISMRGLVIG